MQQAHDDRTAENWIYDFIEAHRQLDPDGEFDLELVAEHARLAWDTDAQDMRARDAAEVYHRESQLPQALTLWVAKVLGEPIDRFAQ
jgi:hypothetical protein